MRIAEDRGGQIGHYLQTFAVLRSSGENVVVDGNCLSACTLLLGLIPKRWINRHGGLSRKMIYMQGREMHGIVADCGAATRRANARSDGRYAARPVRYTGASAASDRR
jgi:hypothetical protein